jgi:anti-sigma regulatory factor (Ser/Thr protein kinase)
MSDPVSELLARRFRCAASAPQLARDAVRELDAIAPVREDATLIVSELVTNAIRHSGSEDEDELELRVVLSPAHVTISVWDVGRSDTVPQLHQREAGRGGLGLHVVAAIASRWGVEDRQGRRVWAEVPFSVQAADALDASVRTQGGEPASAPTAAPVLSVMQGLGAEPTAAAAGPVEL